MSLKATPQRPLRSRASPPANGIVVAVAPASLPAPTTQHHIPQARERSGATASTSNCCCPSSSSSSSALLLDCCSLADLGARINLERIYRLSSSPAPCSLHPHPQLQRASNHSSSSTSSSLQALLNSPTVFLVSLDDKPQQARNQEKSADYYANVGDAIRTLREDIPLLFSRDLNYGIYREDIVFRDPRNSFQGLKNYSTIFWSLRFHGAIFFSKLFVEVRRIWQPEDTLIKMRWTVHGIPRVPWEAQGTFDGVSIYKLDSQGKIYEHSVDNVLLRDPPLAIAGRPLLAGLSLSPSQQPYPGTFCQGSEEEQAQWWQYMGTAVGPCACPTSSDHGAQAQ